MTQHKRLPFLLSIILFFTSSAWAQKIRVTKVKGTQAVVEFSGGTLHAGQAYELSSENFSESGSSARNYVISGSLSFYNTKSDAVGATSDTEIQMVGKFGWNEVDYEFGPQFAYVSQSSGSLSTSSMKFGAFLDYNMIPNTPGETFTYGLGGSGDFGQKDSGLGAKNSLMSFFVGPFAKWFPTGSPLGLRFDGGYFYQKISASSGTDRTTTGINANVGLTAYF